MLTRADRYAALGLLTALLGAAVRPGDCRAQGLIPAPAPVPAQTPAAAPGALKPGERVADLTTRYRFSEHYATNEDANNPQAIVQARVGLLETLKVVTDNPRGTPARSENVATTIYSERVAELGPDGAVTATVRRYKKYQQSPDVTGAKPTDRRPLEGLRVWYQRQPGGPPLVLSLMPDRRLRENEFPVLSGQVFVPALSAVLPPQPSRIGDTWSVQKGAARALLGMAVPSNEVMLATFKDLRAAATAGKLVAVFHVNTEKIPFQAEIKFTFERSANPIDDSRGATYDARGTITDVRLARVSTVPLPESNGRLRRTHTYELTLERQPENTDLLELPPSKPVPTADNSWLTYVDPDRSFHVRHPQWFRSESLPGTYSVQLTDARSRDPDDADVVNFQLLTRTGDAAADRRNLDPDFHRKELEEFWRQNRQNMLMGFRGWLPEAGWPAGMKVYRIEAAQQMVDRLAPVQHRLYLDFYLVLTKDPEGLSVRTQTRKDPPLEFRKEIEDMIKTFKTFRSGPPEP